MYINGKKVLTINNTIYIGENINLDATPKGVYESLSALQTAYPTGTDGIYLTSDNGHWYYYNNGWQDGGVYQATEIADGTITPAKTNFFETKTINKVYKASNYSKTDGYFIQPNGTVTVNADFCYSDYIEIDGGFSYKETIERANYRGIIFYDTNQNYINGYQFTSDTKIVTAPTNAKYCRVSLLTSLYDNYAITQINGYRLNGKYYKDYILVSQDGTGDYTTVTTAVAAAKDGDTIFVKNGNYTNEQVEAWGKAVNIIGESRNQVIISNTTGAYSTPPIEFGSGSLKNLTIIAYANSEVTGWTAYAIHVEDDNLYNNKLLIENCTIKSNANYALGMGMRAGCSVEFRNNDFISPVNAGLYFHDAANTDFAGTQELLVEDCKIITENAAAPVIRIDSQELTGSVVNVTFINNLCRNTEDPTSNVQMHNTVTDTYVSSFNDLINFNLSKYSFNNNKDRLNYDN